MARTARVTASLALWTLGVACGTSASFGDRVFDDGLVRYRVGAQTQGFERITIPDNDLAWHDPRYGTISVNSTCRQTEDVPARVLVNHLLMGTTERVVRVDETVTLDGRGARHLIAELELDGVPVTVAVYLLIKDGCVYDLSQVSAQDKAAAAAPLFDAFAHDFAVLGK